MNVPPTLCLDTPLPYTPDTTTLFDMIRSLSHPIFLDSCANLTSKNSSTANRRYDLITAIPSTRILITEDTLHVFNPPTEKGIDKGVSINRLSYSNSTDIITIILDVYARWAQHYGVKLENEHNHTHEGHSHEGHSHEGHPHEGRTPYMPGLYGYIGYDASSQLEAVKLRRKDEDDHIDFPSLSLGFYPWVIIVDHEKKETWWRSIDPKIQPTDILKPALKPEPKVPFKQQSAWQSNLTQAQYAKRFNTIQDFIQSGDCYQVNFAQRFKSQFKGDPYEGYLQTRKRCPAPFAAFLKTPFGAILSFSPERFISVESGQAITEPIKGTTPRSINPEADCKAKERLAKSGKDRAENLMITDLLRNDFGKVCKIGSVEAESLFKVESFPNVHHMISTVRGELPHETSPLRLLGYCFPGGSITGAPKIRAMQIIDSLEPNQRHIYCGTILHLGLKGFLTSNITIRTLLYHRTQLYCWAGGGIVSDSTCEGEYEETFAKVNAFLETLGTF